MARVGTGAQRREAVPAPAEARAAPGPHAEVAGRIGPNAITRVAEALVEQFGDDATAALFRAAGLDGHLRAPPRDMVAEAEVARLQAQLRASLGANGARAVAVDAGHRTGDYLLAHRIPGAAQALLKHLPARLAARILAAAIARHAWTFAGSGAFSFAPGRPFGLAITGCPLCRQIKSDAPACDFYAATFERIFRQLVSARARVTETACEANGAPACRFEVRW